MSQILNLAGRKDICDGWAESELRRCGIGVVRLGKPQLGEVPCTIAGMLGQFSFARAGTYWVAFGRMPLRMAEELYEHPVGRTDIRVAGHAGCPPPREWATYRTKIGRAHV